MGGIKRHKKAVVWGLAVALAATGAGGWYVWSSRQTDPADAYETAEVTTGDVRQTITGEARVRSGGDVSLFVDSPQTVAAVLVDEGDTVKAGDVLVRYDLEADEAELNRRLTEARLSLNNLNLTLQNISRPVTGAELIQYESAITAAEKNVSDAEGDIESLHSRIRQQRLRADSLRKIANIYEDDYDDDEIGEEDYDVARTNYRVARAALTDLEAQLETKNIALESYRKQLENARAKLAMAASPLADEATAARYTIQQNLVAMQSITIEGLEDDLAKLTAETIAPVDGYVTAVNAVDGGTTSAGAAVVVLSESERRVVRFEASEFDAPLIAAGQRATVTAAGLPGREFTGRVTKIGAVAVDKESGDADEVVVPVEITLDDADESLKLGYTVDVTIVVQERENVVWAPISAIVREGSGQAAYVLENGLAVRRDVELGLYGDKTVEVVSGLADGDVLITKWLG